MTVSSLFNMVLKIIGLLFVRDFLISLPQFLSLISTTIRYGEGLSPIIAAFLSVGLYAVLAYCLLFRTPMVFELFQLNKGFGQQEISMNMHRSSVLNIAIVVIGALIIVDAVPLLVRQLVLYFEYRRSRGGILSSMSDPDYSLIVMYVVQTIIGLLLLGYSRLLVNYLEIRRKNDSR